ncbi:MAG: iron-sulfur cluster assembly accessory protein [Verrucomicrobia bacterium]|nr:MAG: iron-sulfur cluster assembly accessory protein [Verrucomicrobiota bacterium]
MITITPRATAELAHLLTSRATSAAAGLRLAVRRGGCAGWQYEMQVAEPETDDIIVENLQARVIIAADSIEKLKGCEIDFSDDLTDSGFKIHNPSAARSCGCGTSFQTTDEPELPASALSGESCGQP